MKTSQTLLRRILLLLIGLCLVQTASAFFIISIHTGESGEIIIVVLNGPPGQKGPFVLNNVTMSQPGIVQLVTPLPKTGTTPGQIEFEALAPGTTDVNFFGTYNGPNNSVFGQTTITVTQPLLTSGQNFNFGIGGDPVNTRNGEYFATEAADLNLGGPMPLRFVRYVATALETDGVAQGHLGDNRLHNFASRMINVSATGKKVVLPNGRVLTFEKTGTKWVLKKPLDVPFSLVESGTDFILGDPHTQQMWTYDNQQKLVKIEDGRGNTHTLTYVGGLLDEVSDGLGRTLSFDYTGGNISSVTDHTSRSVQFAYTGSVLTSATDPLGHVTAYAYDGSLMTSFTRPEGNTPFTQVFTNGQVTQQTERGTDVSGLAFDTPAARMTTFTDATGETLVDEYAASGHLTKHTDEAGNPITLSKDATGRRSGAVDRAGDATLITYHAGSGRPATIVNAQGGVTTMTYKARIVKGITFYDLTKIALPDGSSRSYTYDARGNVIEITDQAGKKWKMTYNAPSPGLPRGGQVLTRINPLGGLLTATYDNAGNLVSTTDSDTGMGTTTYTYDLLNRLEKIVRPGGVDEMQITYDANDRMVSIEDERGNTYTYTYDDNNRLTEILDPDGKTISYGHDTLDRVTEITDRIGAISSVTYDSRRLLASYTDPNNNVTGFNYNAVRRLTGIMDAGGENWQVSHDAEGLLDSVATPLEPAGKIKRNRLGQPVEANDSLGNTVLLSRDAMQRATRFLDPLGRQTLYAYDKRGILTSITEQTTGTAKFERNAVGSISKLTDPNGSVWSFGYSKMGRLTLLTDPLGRKTIHTYDERGRLKTSTYPDPSILTVTYDATSNVTNRSYSDTTNLSYAYDSLNRLLSATDSTAGGDGTVEFTYDAEGRITKTRQDNIDFSATYDPAGRLQTVTYPDGPYVVTYGYDARNRLISVSDNVNNVILTMAYDDAGRMTAMVQGGTTFSYTYDAAGRLIGLQSDTPTATPLLSVQYTLNAAGEVVSADYTGSIASAIVPSPPAATQSLKYDKASQILATGYTYDARGRLTASTGGHVFTWNAASRLTSVDGVALAYDGLGQLVKRTAGADVTRYFHHHALGLAPIVSIIEPDGFRRYYIYTPAGHLLYSFDQTNAYRFYHFDRIGSTLALTDASGALTDTYAYGPYGEVLPASHAGPSSQPFTYVGRLGVRSEGALFQMRARFYDPTTGRFLSRDPGWPNLADSKWLNPYEYADQNPALFVDPTGRDTEIAHAPLPFVVSDNDVTQPPSFPFRNRTLNYSAIFDEVHDFECTIQGITASPPPLPQSGLLFKPFGNGSDTSDFLRGGPGDSLFHYNPNQSPGSAWDNCSACHPGGWTSGPTWGFGSNPLDTTSLESFFNGPGPFSPNPVPSPDTFPNPNPPINPPLPPASTPSPTPAPPPPGNPTAEEFQKRKKAFLDQFRASQGTAPGDQRQVGDLFGSPPR